MRRPAPREALPRERQKRSSRDRSACPGRQFGPLAGNGRNNKNTINDWETAMSSNTAPQTAELEKVGIGGYISLIIAVVFFSGTMVTDEWWGIFDFTVLNGSFGNLVASVKDVGGEITTTMSSFRGKGGSGAIDGFMFALTLVPPIMLSVAMVNIFEYYGAIKAAGRLLTPILRPLMGLPGYTALSLIASTQSTDAGAALTRTLKDEGRLTEREVLIFATFQMTAGAAIGNFLSSGVVIFTLTDAAVKLCVPTTIGACLGVILLGKLLSANMMRLLLIRKKN